MTHRMGANGQVVIPKTIRDTVGLRPGHAVQFSQEGDAVVLRKASTATQLKGRLAGHQLTDLLLRQRAEDRTDET